MKKQPCLCEKNPFFKAGSAEFPLTPLSIYDKLIFVNSLILSSDPKEAHMLQIQTVEVRMMRPWVSG